MLLHGSRLHLAFVCAAVMSLILGTDSAARIVKLRAGTDVKIFDSYRQSHRERHQAPLSTSSDAENRVNSNLGTIRGLWMDRPLNPRHYHSDLDDTRAEHRPSSQTRPVHRVLTQTASSNGPLIMRNPSHVKPSDLFQHSSSAMHQRHFGNSQGLLDVDINRGELHPWTLPLDNAEHRGISSPTAEHHKGIIPSTGIQTSRFVATHAGSVGKASDSADMKQKSLNLASYEGFKETSSKNGMQSYLFTQPSHGQQTVKPVKTTAAYTRTSPPFILRQKLPKKDIMEKSTNFSNSTENPPASNINLMQTTTPPPAQLPQQNTTLGRFWPQTNILENDAPGSETPIAQQATVKESGNTLVKTLFGLRWLKTPWRPNVREKKNSTFLSISRNRPGFSFNKGRGSSFRVTNVSPALSPKYSFSRRRLPATTSTLAPETSTTARNVPTVELTKTLSLEGDDSPDRTQEYKSHKRIYGLKGFGRRNATTLETAKVDNGSDSSGLDSRKVQSFPVLKYNQTVERDASAGAEPKRLSIAKLSPKIEGIQESTSDKLKKLYNLRGFQPVQRAVQGGTKVKHVLGVLTPRVVAGYFRPEGVRNTNKERAPFHPNSSSHEMKARLLNSFTSGMVRATRVSGRTRKLNQTLNYQNLNVSIVRLPKHPTPTKAVTYADVLGSASFSGVRPDLSGSDQGHHRHPNIESIRADQKVRRQNETETALLSDSEGSGSGGFEMTYSSSTDFTENENNLLDYLSTGNMFFKSMKVPLSIK